MTQHDPGDTHTAAPPVQHQTRPMYWSVLREVWENRSVYLAPLIVAAVVLFGSCVATLSTGSRLKSIDDAARRQAAAVMPYNMAPAPIMLSTFLVGIFYCLDALFSERRDRSILFWKSLPVSDRTTVLSKAAIPFVVLPLLAVAISLAVQVLLAMLSVPVLLANGLRPQYTFFFELLVMLYGMTVHTLWFAPVYGWLLLVSAWARRTPFLWAVLPFVTIGALERIVFGTKYVGILLGYRVMGAMREGFHGAGQSGNITELSHLAPLKFLSTPGLWVGLAFTAGCLALAINLRRRREPI